MKQDSIEFKASKLLLKPQKSCKVSPRDSKFKNDQESQNFFKKL